MGGRHRREPDHAWLTGYLKWFLVLSATGTVSYGAVALDTPQPLPPTIATPTIAYRTTPPLTATLIPPTTTTTTPTKPPTTTTTTTTKPKPTTTTAKPTPLPEKDEPASDCDRSLKNTVPHAAQAGNFIRKEFDLNLDSILGRGSRGTAGSDHPKGLAVDFIVGRATGDRLAEFVYERSDLLSVKYIIWRQRIRYPGGSWKTMEDRGSATANHYDHVHVSFLPSATGDPKC